MTPTWSMIYSTWLMILVKMWLRSLIVVPMTHGRNGAHYQLKRLSQIQSILRLVAERLFQFLLMIQFHRKNANTLGCKFRHLHLARHHQDSEGKSQMAAGNSHYIDKSRVTVPRANVALRDIRNCLPYLHRLHRREGESMLQQSGWQHEHMKH